MNKINKKVVLGFAAKNIIVNKSITDNKLNNREVQYYSANRLVTPDYCTQGIDKIRTERTD